MLWPSSKGDVFQFSMIDIFLEERDLAGQPG